MILTRLKALGLLLLVPFLYLLFLWKMSVPLTGDQKVYLSVALEMRSRGEWIIPYLFDRANFLKPPFQYWATLLGWKAFGFNLVGALFPSLLALVASGLWVRKLSDEKSVLPVLFFTSTIASMTYGTTAQMEIWIVLFYLASWHFYRSQKMTLAFLLVGIMAWVKGPLYPVLWVLSVIFESILNGKQKQWLKAKSIFNLVLGVSLGLLWYAVAARTHASEMLAVFLFRENIGKMSTGHGTMIGLWSEFLITLFPILPWWLMSLTTPELKARWKLNRHFWVAFGLFPALFFTFFPYRVNTYLYLLTPLVVWMLKFNSFPIEKRVHRFLSFGVLAIAFLFSVLVFRLMWGGWMSNGLGIAFVFSLLFWVVGHFRLRPTWVAVGSLLIVTGVRIAGTQLGEWDLKGLRNDQEHHSGALAYFMDSEDIWHEFGLVSAAIEKPIELLREETAVRKFLETGGAVILTEAQDSISLGAACEPWIRLKKRMKFPIQELMLKGLSIEDPALHRSYRICRIQKS